MNVGYLLGTVASDPDIKTFTSASGTAMTVAKYRLAVPRGRKDKDGNNITDFFTITAFGKTAEWVQKYVQKRRKFLVTYRVENDNYEKDGKTVYRDTYVAVAHDFADSRPVEQPAGYGAPAGGYSAPAAPAAPAAPPAYPGAYPQAAGTSYPQPPVSNPQTGYAANNPYQPPANDTFMQMPVETDLPFV